MGKGFYINGAGYKLRLQRGHPGADRDGFVYEHRIVAENALRYQLPPRAEVHHVNGLKADNRNSNLVICENHAYHRLLHRRARALRCTGTADSSKCPFCKQWDLPKNLVVISCQAYHRQCKNAATKQQRIRTGRFKGARPRGEQLHSSKLIASDVVEMRETFKAGGVSMQLLAKQFGVSSTTISSIVRREAWKHIL